MPFCTLWRQTHYSPKQSFALKLHGAALTMKHGDQFKHNPPETTHLIMPNMTLDHNGHMQLEGNLSMHITAWDNILLHVRPRVHSISKDVITSDFNNLHQYTTTEQLLIIRDNVRKLCLPPLQTIAGLNYTRPGSVLHKSMMWVHRINTALNVYQDHRHCTVQWTSTSLSSEVSESSSLTVSTRDTDTLLLM